MVINRPPFLSTRTSLSKTSNCFSPVKCSITKSAVKPLALAMGIYDTATEGFDTPKVAYHLSQTYLPQTYFEVEYIYHDEPVVLPSLDKDRILGIDLGVDNLAACASTTGHIFLIDGKKLKAVNQWYNKERARLQSIGSQHRSH